MLGADDVTVVRCIEGGNVEAVWGGRSRKEGWLKASSWRLEAVKLTARFKLDGVVGTSS